MAEYDDEEKKDESLDTPTEEKVTTTAAPTSTPDKTAKPKNGQGNGGWGGWGSPFRRGGGATGSTAADPSDPWGQAINDWRGRQDARRQDFRDGMDKFRGDFRQGLQDWQAQRDQFRTDFRNGLNDRIQRLGKPFGMPEGFASRLPWNWGQSGASGLGGTVPPAPAGTTPATTPTAPAQGVAAGEPNPATPQDEAKRRMLSFGRGFMPGATPGAQGSGVTPDDQGKRNMLAWGRGFMPGANPNAQATGSNPALDAKKPWRW